MSNQVYANNMEVSCKAAAGKSICAFPDVCFTPPQTPATPPGVPIPYPNTGMASDTTSGSTSVKISGKEVMLKNKSYFKKSMGDEAGCAPKKGVVTSKNMGKVYFTKWSMDVKAEGENVVRMGDLTTHNHGSVPGNTSPWPYVDEVAAPGITEKCKGDMEKEKEACSEYKPHGAKEPCPGRLAASDSRTSTATKAEKDAQKCLDARRCRLAPYKRSTRDGIGGCCPGQTPHHIVPAHSCKGIGKYDLADAPCVCAEGFSWHRKDKSKFAASEKTHPAIHEILDVVERKVIALAEAAIGAGKGGFLTSKGLSTAKPWNYNMAKMAGTQAVKQALGDRFACDDECTKAQLDAYHNQSKINDSTPLNAKEYGNVGDSPDYAARVDRIYNKS